jgi:ABC-type Zn2+ transport system substrate-binding protein/surface adhesin
VFSLPTNHKYKSLTHDNQFRRWCNNKVLPVQFVIKFTRQNVEWKYIELKHTDRNTNQPVLRNHNQNHKHNNHKYNNHKHNNHKHKHIGQLLRISYRIYKAIYTRRYHHQAMMLQQILLKQLPYSRLLSLMSVLLYSLDGRRYTY